MTPQLVMAAVLVFGGGLVATVSGLAWDLRLQRRDRRPDVGLSILRSDADDATPAEVLGLVDAIRETAAADVVLSAAADAGHQGASRGARPAGSLPSRHMAGGPGGNPVRIRRSPLLDQVRPAWDAPTSELPAVELLPVAWPAVAPALPLPLAVSMRPPGRWMRWQPRWDQPALELEVA